MRRNLIAATSAVGAVAIALGLGLAWRGPVRPPAQPILSAPLLQALSAAKQPSATLTALRAAAELGEPCGYAELATRAALDADLHEWAVRTLDAAPAACPRAAQRDGQRAEALARANSDPEAERLAHAALQADAKNAHAELALARVSYNRNQMGASSEHAQRALQLGRGVEAERLLARTDLARGRYGEAEAHYRALSRSNPEDVEAAFSGAVCNDKLGRYHAAREGFLRTLKINPQHAEARRYLVVLTYNSGAKEEARHHLTKLAAIVSKDSTVLAELESLFESGGSRPALVASGRSPKP